MSKEVFINVVPNGTIDIDKSISIFAYGYNYYISQILSYSYPLDSEWVEIEREELLYLASELKSALIKMLALKLKSVCVCDMEEPITRDELEYAIHFIEILLEIKNNELYCNFKLMISWSY